MTIVNSSKTKGFFSPRDSRLTIALKPWEEQERAAVKKAGGKWDAVEKLWVMPSAEALTAAETAVEKIRHESKKRKAARSEDARRWRSAKSTLIRSACICDEMDEDNCPQHARNDGWGRELAYWGDQFND